MSRKPGKDRRRSMADLTADLFPGVEWRTIAEVSPARIRVGWEQYDDAPPPRLPNTWPIRPAVRLTGHDALRIDVVDAVDAALEWAEAPVTIREEWAAAAAAAPSYPALIVAATAFAAIE